jgi:CheY-like chemotaxis protein
MKKVLICDDDPDILEVTRTILLLKGYNVETMMTTEGLFPKVAEFKPDLILMDLWIPETGGEKATRDLKGNPSTEEIPVVLFSANNDIDKVAKSTGANGYLRKPFEIEQLEKVIASNIA